MLDGEYPDWFVAEYGLARGGFALRRVWADVIALERLDPFPKQLLVWQLQDAFGGYCSHERVAASAYQRRATYQTRGQPTILMRPGAASGAFGGVAEVALVAFCGVVALVGLAVD